MATLLKLFSLKIVGVPQPKLLHGISLNCQDMFSIRGFRADLVLERFQVQLLAVAIAMVLRFLTIIFILAAGVLACGS